jgi:hypothetical protein
MRAVIASAVCLLMPLGCALVPTDTFRNTPSAKICLDYLTTPTYNVWRAAREAELARRGENCSAYAAQAVQMRQGADAAEMELGLRLLQPPAPPRAQQCQWQQNANGTGSMVCY